METTGRCSYVIEITPEMIEAGVAEFCANNAEDNSSYVVEDILTAALEAGGYRLRPEHS